MVLPAGILTESIAAMMSLVEVLPALPVTPITGPAHVVRAHVAIFCSAARVSGTTRTRGSLETFADTFAITATAPLARASRTNALPSKLGPRRAKKRSPGVTVRVSVLQPVMRASFGVVSPKTWAISLIENSIVVLLGRSACAALAIAQLPQDRARGFPVVKMYDAIFQHLIRLVALAGQYHDIVRFGFFESGANRFFAIRLGDVRRVDAAQPHHGVVHDGERIFGARIVRSQHHEIASLPRGHAHQRTLGAVAIASAAEQGDDARRLQRPRHRDGVFQCVVGVRVVHHDEKRLACVYFFKSPRDVAALRDAARDGVPIEAITQRCSARRHDVIGVNPAYQG